MLKKTFALFIGLSAAVAIAGCGQKEDAAPAEDAQTEQTAEESIAEEAGALPPAANADAAHGSELTKVSSQGAAAEQGQGVFVKAREGDPEAVYLARCQYCHIQLGPGTITLSRRLGPEEALLANRTDLTEDYIKTVVRTGLNTMPALTRVEVSDDELDLIAEYLTRNNE